RRSGVHRRGPAYFRARLSRFRRRPRPLRLRGRRARPLASPARRRRRVVFVLGGAGGGCQKHAMRLPALLVLTVLALAGCARPGAAGYQGYLEGEFVYVSSPLAGRLETLAVQKGARGAAGAALFTLERSAEMAAQQQAAEELRAAQAR